METVPGALRDIAESLKTMAKEKVHVTPEKIWVVHRECVIDYELSSREIKVFHNESDARKAFGELAKHDREYCTKSEWEVGTDNEACFDAYEDGWYAQNHILIELSETVIN